MHLKQSIALMLLSILLAGCGTHVSIPAWQKSVNHFIREEGNGDPTVLGGRRADAHHPGFSLIGKNYTYDSDDARGVLLAHRTINGRAWFIYLVGMVDHEHVDDIRLAALTMRDGKPHWETGQRSSRATGTYRNWNYTQGRSRFPARKMLPAEYRGFPRESDDFRLDVNDDERISVHHDESGAWWVLELNARE